MRPRPRCPSPPSSTGQSSVIASSRKEAVLRRRNATSMSLQSSIQATLSQLVIASSVQERVLQNSSEFSSIHESSIYANANEKTHGEIVLGIPAHSSMRMGQASLRRGSFTVELAERHSPLKQIKRLKFPDRRNTGKY